MITPQDIANILLDIGAVALNVKEPFTYTSGLRSPIYCDNRMIISHPSERTKVIDGFIEKIEQEKLEFDVVGGTSTAGIPYAAFLAERLSLPMVYIRGSAKGHGKKKQVEGDLKAGQRVLIIEDLISTGGSSIDSVNGVRNEGGEVTDVLAIFSYGLKQATVGFKESNVKVNTLCTFEILLPVAVARKQLTEEEGGKALQWRVDPELWAKHMNLD
ncbi:MAG: orotate phosphoribosyltransferase [Candidatus Kerfeldbacteria bacterium CG15_BIG_FIL_POST_REV_8_21_14_020_45_12]|uniref:Orotate phosphoribosyltransferase n=1 Tax=Candidatus Kerfeldbacteria bacterium CG15_BIG_FIL_POST_REV_8_21_14_020_45_12 TaxID=2014247 RepID=A0A2M7H536_9BACT|nr:MAG: orotate phosphoribosyltransferase [Candidatus Kerfeldbacteria bacterium CG15_BIG_FIL_POST_REV_8_21_14_020_45_12]